MRRIHSTARGEGILASALDAERGRLHAVSMYTARRVLPGFDEVDADVYVTVAAALRGGVPDRIRFQCQQNGDVTSLHAKVWPAGDEEPAEWRASFEDGTPELQDPAGSFAADVYNYGGTGSIYVDDVSIAAM